MIIPSSRGFNFKTSAHLSMEVWVLRHEDTTLGSNLKMTPKAVRLFIRLCGLGPVRCDNVQCHNFKEVRKDLQQNQIDNEGGGDL